MQTQLLIINPKTSVKNYVDNFLLDLIKKKSPNDFEYYLNKIQNNLYLDLKKFDGNIAKKQEIIDVLNNFLLEGIEKVNIKILLIENIDKANKFITNSLLKFIEEIPKNTYVIFSSKNKNDVIPTIISRCSIINLKQDELLIKEIFDKIESYDFSNLETEILLDDIDKLFYLIKNDKLSIVKFLKDTFLNLKNGFEFEKLKNIFKELEIEQIEILLKILFINLNDVKTKREIIDLLRFSESQINKNGLLIILINLFI